MDKVFLLWLISDYEDENDELKGIFKTKEKALNYCSDNNIKLGSNRRGESHYYELEEKEIF